MLHFKQNPKFPFANTKFFPDGNSPGWEPLTEYIIFVSFRSCFRISLEVKVAHYPKIIIFDCLTRFDKEAEWDP